MKLIIRSFRFSVALVALIALTITPSRSQVNIKLGGGIGVTSPASDFSGSTLEYYNGSRYGLSSGLNIHGKAKIGLSGLNLAGEIDYSSLRNTGNSEPGQGKVDISQKILSLKVGPEFRLSVPALPLTPYIGANLALNRFSGETTFQGVSKVPSATYSVKDATRFGVGFSAGTEVSLGPFLSLDFNISYNLMNVSGKEWDDVNPGINQRIDSYLSLNDDHDPQYAAGDDKHFISNERSIRSILFTASILFGL
jgi:opacity protein-like surface antigen